jgi:hypothetical protein
LRLGSLVALLRAANGLVEKYGTNADADANADTAATTTTPVATAAVPTTTAHVAGKRWGRAGGADDQEERQGRSK